MVQKKLCCNGHSCSEIRKLFIGTVFFFFFRMWFTRQYCNTGVWLYLLTLQNFFFFLASIANEKLHGNNKHKDLSNVLCAICHILKMLWQLCASLFIAIHCDRHDTCFSLHLAKYTWQLNSFLLPDAFVLNLRCGVFELPCHLFLFDAVVLIALWN